MDDFTLRVLCTALISTATIILIFSARRRRTTHPPPLPIPPSPPYKLPIIGHLHLLSALPHHSFARLADQLASPIIFLQIGQVPTVVISSPQLAELVLKTHDHAFLNRPQLVAVHYLSFGGSDLTFSHYGQHWRQARKICVTELLSARRVNSFQLVRDEEVNRLIHTITTSISDPGRSEVDMSELFFTLANNVICRIAFGKRFVNASNGEGHKSDLVTVLMETQALLSGFSVGDFFPEWDWVNSVSGMKRRLTKNLEDLKRVCDGIINEHVNKGEKSRGDGEHGGDDATEKKDFVDVLLSVQRQQDLEVPVTDDNLKALILDMFVAGTDTTFASLEWTMTALVRHPEVMKKAQAEIREAARGEHTIHETDLRQLPYLKAVIKESMRLHPAVPMVPRETTQRCTLNGYEIPEKTRVLINTYAIGRDPKSWENPLDFKPERFIEKDIDFRGQDFGFVPFGGGRRGCPGISFVLAIVEITLARLLYHFDWELPSGVRADDVDMDEVFGLAIRRKTALKLVPVLKQGHAQYVAET